MIFYYTCYDVYNSGQCRRVVRAPVLLARSPGFVFGSPKYNVILDHTMEMHIWVSSCHLRL